MRGARCLPMRKTRLAMPTISRLPATICPPTRWVSGRVPDWAYYSHDAGGNPLEAYHDNGVSLLLDQGHETMEGASGDDWISVAQSMRAYLRFSLLGGVVGEQIRRLGFSARVHSVLDGDVLQPPLLLLSGPR